MDSKVYALLVCMLVLGCNTSTDIDMQTRPLLNTEWTLALFNIDGYYTTPPENQKFTIQFHNDSTCSGQNNCNTWFAEYDHKGPDSLTIYKTASTEIYCGKNSWDQTFLKLLRTTTTYKTHLNTLWLYQGKTLFFEFKSDE